MLTTIQMFVWSTEQTLVENGMTREQAAEWREKVREGEIVRLTLLPS
jgi:hypothetical protein